MDSVEHESMRMRIYSEVHALLCKVDIKKCHKKKKVYVTTSILTSEISNTVERIMNIKKEYG